LFSKRFHPNAYLPLFKRYFGKKKKEKKREFRMIISRYIKKYNLNIIPNEVHMDHECIKRTRFDGHVHSILSKCTSTRALLHRMPPLLIFRSGVLFWWDIIGALRAAHGSFSRQEQQQR
jgi:hypothetical protein